MLWFRAGLQRVCFGNADFFGNGLACLIPLPFAPHLSSAPRQNVTREKSVHPPHVKARGGVLATAVDNKQFLVVAARTEVDWSTIKLP